MGDGCVDSRQSRCPSLAKTSGITDSSASALGALLAATLGCCRLGVAMGLGREIRCDELQPRGRLLVPLTLQACALLSIHASLRTWGLGRERPPVDENAARCRRARESHPTRASRRRVPEWAARASLTVRRLSRAEACTRARRCHGSPTGDPEGRCGCGRRTAGARRVGPTRRRTRRLPARCGRHGDGSRREAAQSPRRSAGPVRLRHRAPSRCRRGQSRCAS
jgi:hypothetical protein